ncbi:MAG: single-stranded DNA-binding protein [Stackebrandtia sp.]
MYETTITIVGNVATPPSQRQYPTGSMTEFRVASTSRRFDKQQDKWVDGDELFVKVRCWKTLGEHVEKSVKVGDPVIVRGRMYSRRIVGDDNVPRYVYEVTAQAVGHDLSRGVSEFVKDSARTRTPAGARAREHSEFDAIVDQLSSDDGAAQTDDSAAVLAS